MPARRAAYTHGQHESVWRSHRWRTAANSAAYLLPHLRRGDALLDVGCGTGTITGDLADAIAPGRVCAVDSSPEAVQEARTTLRARRNVDVLVGDVYELHAAGDSFDVVHAHQLLQHLADPVGALIQMRRVCRPGGIVAVRDADYAAMAWYPAEPALDDWLAMYRGIARANGGDPDAGRHLLSWANAAGLKEVIATASAWCFATPEDRRWWAGTWASRVVDSALGRQAMEQGYASRTDLQRIAQGWLMWAERDGGWFAVPHGELIARP